MGKPGFPIPPPGGRVWESAALTQGIWGNRISPSPHPVGGWGRAQPSRSGSGETGFPHPPARGRARPSRRGRGKPGFPIPPPGGRVWEGLALTQRIWGNRVSPSPRPVGGWGRAAPSRRGSGETGFPHPPARWGVWEGAALPGTPYGHPVGVRREPHGRLISPTASSTYRMNFSKAISPRLRGCEGHLRGLVRRRRPASQDRSPRRGRYRPFAGPPGRRGPGTGACGEAQPPRISTT